MALPVLPVAFECIRTCGLDEFFDACFWGDEQSDSALNADIYGRWRIVRVLGVELQEVLA